MKIKQFNEINELTELGLVATGSACLFIDNPNFVLKSIAICFAELLTLEEIYRNYAYKNSDEYKQIKPLYDEIIIRLANLMKSLGANNPIQIYNIFNYLYTNGYISKDNIDKQKCITKDIPLILGMGVINKTDLSRNIAPMLNDILINMGYNSGTINTQTKNDIKMTKNHVIVRTDDKNKLYTFDLPQKKYLKGNYRFYNVITNEYEMKKCINKSYSFSKYMGTNVYKNSQNAIEATINDYVVNEKEANEILLDNYDLIINFKCNNKDIYEEIYNILDNQVLIRKNK